MNRLITLLLALLLDLSLGDPPNHFHPLLLMGRWLRWGRKLAPPRRRFWFGAGWTILGATVFALPFWQLEKWIKQPDNKRRRFHPVVIHSSVFFLYPLLLKPVFAYRNLRRAVIEVSRALAANDLPEARR